MKNVFQICLAILLFSACVVENDLQPPYFDSILVNSIEGDVIVGTPGTLAIRVKCADNEQLGQLTFDIYHAFDGTDHGKVPSDTFSFNNTLSLSGRSRTVSKVVNIPPNTASGPYIMEFRLIDDSGNAAPIVTRNLEIVNSGQPTVTITFPNFASQTEYSSQTLFVMEGGVEDDTEIKEIEVSCEQIDTQTEIYSQEWSLEGQGVTSWNLKTDGNVQFPLLNAVGDCHVIVKVVDNDGNVTREVYPFVVIN